MAYPNLSNKCLFEGRCTSSYKEEMVNTANGQMLKIRFSISVPRAGVKANNNNNGQQQKTNDFVNCCATGIKADFIKKYFAPGRAIKVETVFTEWNYTDATGNRKTGYNFDVVDASFVSSDAQNAAQAGQWAANQNNSDQQQPQQNYGGQPQGGYNQGGYQQNPQQPMQQPGPAMNNNMQGQQQPMQGGNSDFAMFDNNNMPF